MGILTKDDIASVLVLIDAMSQRGAIRGEELVAIGTLRQTYKNALDDAAAKEPVGPGTNAVVQEDEKIEIVV